MESIEEIVAWIQAFPLTSVPGLFWTIFTLTLIVMAVGWRSQSGRVSRGQVGLSGLAFVVMIGTEKWLQSAGAWAPVVTFLFYVASIAALVIGLFTAIGALGKGR
jgi:hypothetical protein